MKDTDIIEELEMPWTEEFAPKCIDDMVLNEDIKTNIKNLLGTKTKFNQCFAGPAGMGKSTICDIIARELNGSVLYVQCGINGTVAFAQSTIKNFCESLSMEGKQKIVILDELDAASGSGDSSFQKTMRNIINDSKDTMFLASCNYLEKVIQPLRSRLGVMKLEFTARDLLARMIQILKAKKIKFTKESVSAFVNKVIKTHYPDIRRIVSDLQKLCATGELVMDSSVIDSSTGILQDLVEKCKTEKDVLALREFYCTNSSRISDYTTFASELFNYVLDKGYVNDRDAVLRLSNIIYQMNLVIDKEIQLFAMIVVISKYIRNDI